jgi:hypothetical protein
MVCFGLVVLALGKSNNESSSSARTNLEAGTIRYFRIQYALTHGMFPVARLTTASITFVLATIVILVFSILLSART